MYLHRNFSNSNTLVIPPQRYQGIAWAGAVALLLQLPLDRHSILCCFQNHQNKAPLAVSSRECHRCRAASDGVEMFPRTLHLLHSMLTSILLPDSPEKPVLGFSCHRCWTLKQNILHLSYPFPLGVGMGLLFCFL